MVIGELENWEIDLVLVVGICGRIMLYIGYLQTADCITTQMASYTDRGWLRHSWAFTL